MISDPAWHHATTHVTRPHIILYRAENMTWDEAVEWMRERGGTVSQVGRTSDETYYQARVGPHRSVHSFGIKHKRRTTIPPTDPEFQRIFIKLVEDVRAVLDRHAAK
jgi:hypothetical protein